MNGMGIDRHLFALYVISKGLDYVSHIIVLFLCSGWGERLRSRVEMLQDVDSTAVLILFEWNWNCQTLVCTLCCS